MTEKLAVPIEPISKRIFLIRGHRTMLDFHLAELYEVETKTLKQAVKRNISRFPEDFMFQLTWNEVKELRSQIVTLQRKGQHIRYLPYAFTEQGVAMLSSVLKSERAIEVNITIMRAFVRLRGMLASHEELSRKLTALERNYEKHDEQIKVVFSAIRELMKPPDKPRRKIGYK